MGGIILARKPRSQRKRFRRGTTTTTNLANSAFESSATVANHNRADSYKNRSRKSNFDVERSSKTRQGAPLATLFPCPYPVSVHDLRRVARPKTMTKVI